MATTRLTWARLKRIAMMFPPTYPEDGQTLAYNAETGTYQPITGGQGEPGPQGPPGPAGADGADGADGAQGIQGIQGIQGPAGADGADGDGGLTAAEIVDLLHPVGSIYIAIVSTNPGTLFGRGTWVAFGAGRVIVGHNASDADFDTAEETGGAKTHTLTSSEMPSHTHVQNAHTHTQNAHSHTMRHFPTATGGSTGNTMDTSMSGTQTNSGLTTADATAVNQDATAVNQNTGGGGAHNNVQPYIVAYCWKRTA